MLKKTLEIILRAVAAFLLLGLASEVAADSIFLKCISKEESKQHFFGLFENPNITIAGIGIRDDIKDLNKLKKFVPQGFVDLNEKAQKLDFESIGARNFSGMFFGGRISKGQQVSNWENVVLTDAQIDYAATDAWICIRIFEEMDQISN